MIAAKLQIPVLPKGCFWGTWSYYLSNMAFWNLLTPRLQFGFSGCELIIPLKNMD
jgi:hypothetical protein